MEITDKFLECIKESINEGSIIEEAVYNNLIDNDKDIMKFVSDNIDRLLNEYYFPNNYCMLSIKEEIVGSFEKIENTFPLLHDYLSYDFWHDAYENRMDYIENSNKYKTVDGILYYLKEPGDCAYTDVEEPTWVNEFDCYIDEGKEYTEEEKAHMSTDYIMDWCNPDSGHLLDYFVHCILEEHEEYVDTISRSKATKRRIKMALY